MDFRNGSGRRFSSGLAVDQYTEPQLGKRDFRSLADFYGGGGDANPVHPGPVSGATAGGPGVVCQVHVVTPNADERVLAAHVLRRVEGAEVNVRVYPFARRRGADEVVSFPEREALGY
jgi:hypothetical protein